MSKKCKLLTLASSVAVVALVIALTVILSISSELVGRWELVEIRTYWHNSPSAEVTPGGRLDIAYEFRRNGTVFVNNRGRSEIARWKTVDDNILHIIWQEGSQIGSLPYWSHFYSIIGDELHLTTPGGLLGVVKSVSVFQRVR